MTRETFDDLLRDVPDRVGLSPTAAWTDARRRRLRRRALAAGLSATAVLALAVGLANLTGTDRAEPAPYPGATFLRAESDGDTWKVTRSDGTTLTLDPKDDFPGATLGLSPDGRWLSYAQGPESGAILNLYLLRSDQIEPHRASQIGATWGFPHQWSPDSKLVLVPVVDGDVNVVDTDARRVNHHQSSPGAATGFVDEDSLGWITAQGSAGNEALTWEVTDLEMTPERSLPLQMHPGILNPPDRPRLKVEQASLSPDGSRVAALLANQRGLARVLVFSTTSGELVDRQDSTESELQLDCPFRWESGSAMLPRPGETCVVEPN